MKTILNVLLAALLLSTTYSCKKDTEDNPTTITTPDTCGTTFYYYFNQKVYLGTYSDTLTVGFRPGITKAEIVKTLKKYPFVKPLDETKLNPTAGFVFVPIGGFSDCAAVPQIMAVLKSDSNITYANQLLYATNTADHTRSSAGLTDQFVVGLKDPGDLKILEDFAKTTQTTIRASGSSYVLTVDKTNDRNALEMANFFYESGLFYYAEPNFLVTVTGF